MGQGEYYASYSDEGNTPTEPQRFVTSTPHIRHKEDRGAGGYVVTGGD